MRDAQDLLLYTQTLALTGQLARAEPKRLRYRLLHTAGRLAFHARKAVLRLSRSWPWAGDLAAGERRGHSGGRNVRVVMVPVGAGVV